MKHHFCINGDRGETHTHTHTDQFIISQEVNREVIDLQII